ncbi:helix-turn-helix transcriptional regulator [Paenibacillus sedimenti]|uniref:Helix-turn-helix transcriptional regulator n=1 Tax=Paenibacillus sedimenti TaxID=2770274 RepID=A0A926KPF9_9BACL|nr:AraC family transcriptional regulator [Paenibacillus sedimenti]MBD0381495.1 helix-turn-helix transcriptional regulator [Paenibacillus sedimenti]
MVFYQFSVDVPVVMDMTGKFVSPSPEWKHMNRVLMDYELFIQTRGTMYISCGTESFALKEGEFLIMPPRSQQFGYQESDCSFYWLHFSTHGHETIHDAALEHVYEPGIIVLPQTGKLRSPEKLIVMLKQLQDSIRSYREQTLNNYLTTSILCEIYNQMFFAQNQSRKLLKQQLYNDIVDYIKWNRQENIRVTQLAKHFGYNAKHLSSLFSSMAGVSLKQFIVQEKMEAAKFLLTDTNQKINEISMQLGFPDSHSFTKSFKKITSLTPTDYRNAYANRLLYYK